MIVNNNNNSEPATATLAPPPSLPPRPSAESSTTAADPPPANAGIAPPVPPPSAPSTKTDATSAVTAVTKVNTVTLAVEAGADHPLEESGIEDLKKQKAEKDFSGDYGKRTFCRRLHLSMLPIRILFIIAGRYPFYYTREEDGTYLYKFTWVFPGTIHFFVITICMFYVVIAGTWDMAHITLNYSISHGENTPEYQDQRRLEDVLLNRYYIPIIFVFASLLHGCIASILTFKKRHYIAHYLTFWSKAVHTMHMDVSRQALGFSVKILVLFCIIVTVFSLLASYKVGPTAVGLPTLFGDLLFRFYLPNDGWLASDTTTRRAIQISGAIFLILTFIASKSSILFFIYHCKTLKSAFAHWNGRVYAAVLRGGEFSQTEEGRTTYKLLFKDHCVLMDLLEGMDQVYAFTMESYFGLQVFSLFFELYFCIRTAKHGDSREEAAYPIVSNNAFFVRPKDWAPGLIMLFISISLMLTAAKSAADMDEEAKAGMEVLRRKTMLGRKTDEELYFMLSMFSSYTAYKRMQITGGGYYYMNKDFIIGLISSVLSYFIILYQFQPVMDRPYPASNPATRPVRQLVGKFLAGIEGLESDHYETTQSSSDGWERFRP